MSHFYPSFPNRQYPQAILPAAPGAIGPGERINVDPLTARGWQKDIDATISPTAGTQNVIASVVNITSDSPCVLRFQWQSTADAVANAIAGFLRIATSIDGGTTTIQRALYPWGVAVQVPAGTSRADVVITSSGLAAIGTTRPALIHASPGFLREKIVAQTLTEADVAAALVVTPPAFAVSAKVEFLGAAGSYTFQGSSMTLAQTLNAARTSAEIEAQVITLPAVVAPANMSILWRVYE